MHVATFIFVVVWSSLTTSSIRVTARSLWDINISWLAWTFGIVKWVSSFGFFFAFLGGCPMITMSSATISATCLGGFALRVLISVGLWVVGATKVFPCFVFRLLWWMFLETGAVGPRGILTFLASWVLRDKDWFEQFFTRFGYYKWSVNCVSCRCSTSNKENESVLSSGSIRRNMRQAKIGDHSRLRTST